MEYFALVVGADPPRKKGVDRDTSSGEWACEQIANLCAQGVPPTSIKLLLTNPEAAVGIPPGVSIGRAVESAMSRGVEWLADGASEARQPLLFFGGEWGWDGPRVHVGDGGMREISLDRERLAGVLGGHIRPRMPLGLGTPQPIDIVLCRPPSPCQIDGVDTLPTPLFHRPGDGWIGPGSLTHQLGGYDIRVGSDTVGAFVVARGSVNGFVKGYEYWSFTGTPWPSSFDLVPTDDMRTCMSSGWDVHVFQAFDPLGEATLPNLNKSRKTHRAFSITEISKGGTPLPTTAWLLLDLDSQGYRQSWYADEASLHPTRHTLPRTPGASLRFEPQPPPAGKKRLHVKLDHAPAPHCKW